MKTKLTLSIDKDLIQFARQQAHNNNKSVSGMFSEFLLSRKSQTEKMAGPNAASMVGSLKPYKIDDSKTAIRSAYVKKHIN